MAIAFAGTSPFGAAILSGMLDGAEGRPGVEVALVISQPDRPAGRGKKLQSPPVAQLAKERGMRLVQPERMHDEEMLALYEELGIKTFVVAAFGQMVREPVLSNYLMLNVHGSILPKYRGAAPIERAIMADDSETGVDIMRMEAGLDTGPVAHRAKVKIEDTDDAGSLFSKLERAAIPILLDALNEAESGVLAFNEQPVNGSTYAHKITAQDRALSLAMSAREFFNTVRALSPHVGAWLNVDGERLGIWKVRIVGGAEDSISGRIPAHQGEIVHDRKRMLIGVSGGAVEVLELQPAGKRRMETSAWLPGLREPLKQATGAEIAE